jgi:2-amino-4-hydroxy-6-hydroxymethyldihydropteridine diphosphokinase
VSNPAQFSCFTTAHATTAPAAIALGSNLSAQLDGLGNHLDPTQILAAALELLGQSRQVQVLRHSRWYETLPVGPPQPNYVNGCALLEVSLSPADLLQTLQSVEARLGRVRQVHWGPRSLDLDLLLYGQEIIQTPTLTLPHPRMRERGFVLVPLAEIAPDWIEPVTQQSIAQLQTAVDCSGIQPIFL